MWVMIAGMIYGEPGMLVVMLGYGAAIFTLSKRYETWLSIYLHTSDFGCIMFHHVKRPMHGSHHLSDENTREISINLHNMSMVELRRNTQEWRRKASFCP